LLTYKHFLKFEVDIILDLRSLKCTLILNPHVQKQNIRLCL